MKSEIDPRIATVVETLRCHISEQKYQVNHKLPPERELAAALNLPRNRLRQAMAQLEILGEVWRHVGKGTFVGSRKPGSAPARVIELIQTSPDEIMEARLLFEPKMAALAAIRGTDTDFQTLGDLVSEGEATQDFATGQSLNDRLHRAIAIATHNNVMLWLFDGLFTVRQATSWGKLQSIQSGREHREVWTEHKLLVDAITARDGRMAERRMYDHLDILRKRILGFAK
jgi:DNA-binding FadR family transcriptional regulator